LGSDIYNLYIFVHFLNNRDDADPLYSCRKAPDGLILSIASPLDQLAFKRGSFENIIRRES